jgi:hypothetical protein
MIADVIAKDAEGRDDLSVEVRGRVLEPEIIPEYFETVATLPGGFVRVPEACRELALQ